MVKSYGQSYGAAGRQVWLKLAGSLLHTKSSLPLEVTLTVLKLCPYKTNGNGNSINVLHQMQ